MFSLIMLDVVRNLKVTFMVWKGAEFTSRRTGACISTRHYSEGDTIHAFCLYAIILSSKSQYFGQLTKLSFQVTVS